MKLPSTAPPEIQEAFREVWRTLDRWTTGPVVDLHGRRIGNACAAVDPFDYVTLGDLEDRVGQEGDLDLDLLTVDQLTVRGTTRLQGPVVVTSMLEGAI